MTKIQQHLFSQIIRHGYAELWTDTEIKTARKLYDLGILEICFHKTAKCDICWVRNHCFLMI